ncbi:PREDICTED: uncharacterized protein LOC104826400 isoform X2 [Tarenaya hassleriana]|uniref:uncharacterized protein LOC104826400 isoform X2 n=1 Tax=Tarenaya hassleriana TaxID=28532 RepID=UPI00053C85E9|nr:PREDICTED: uncharacterized protein LOC104826400 isoform X2 [Tarenaya hassleriana]
MDYSLAAVKMLCSQLRQAKATPSQNAAALGGVLFQRAWFQGVLVSTPDSRGDSRMILDDGTGLVELGLSSEFGNRQWKSGMYLMVVGVYHIRTGDIPQIKIVTRVGCLSR